MGITGACERCWWQERGVWAFVTLGRGPQQAGNDREGVTEGLPVCSVVRGGCCGGLDKHSQTKAGPEDPQGLSPSSQPALSCPQLLLPDVLCGLREVT